MCQIAAINHPLIDVQNTNLLIIQCIYGDKLGRHYLLQFYDGFHLQNVINMHILEWPEIGAKLKTNY